MSYLLSQFPKGPHPADGSLAVDGAYVDLMNQAYREAPQYRVRFTEPTPLRTGPMTITCEPSRRNQHAAHRPQSIPRYRRPR